MKLIEVEGKWVNPDQVVFVRAVIAGEADASFRSVVTFTSGLQMFRASPDELARIFQR